MRVLCIDGVSVGHIGIAALTGQKWNATSSAVVIEGEVYTVVDTFEFDGGLFYELAERPAEFVYLSRRFIPLSNANEMELVNTKEDSYA
jgi:hypothetical protein